jgi:hypothetical protein
MKFREVKIGLWVLAASAVPIANVCAVEIEPPKVQLVDKFGVNMANGQVTHNMEIVSIGGTMGLSDSISIHANEIDFKGYRAFQHKFFGRAVDTPLNNSATIGLTPRSVMRVYGPVGSADFAYYVGTTQQDNGSAISNYRYEPLGDTRNSLDLAGNYLVWTTPDGTELQFLRANMNLPASAGGLLESIKYPSGFVITISPGAVSVSTNTGFQLRQTFEIDSNSCTAPTNVIVRPSSASGWSMKNPKHVVAINAAVAHCPVSSLTCNEDERWPQATFDWPHCMPDMLYQTDNQMSVTNSRGVKTTYKFKRYDLAYETVQGGVVALGKRTGEEFSPRLDSVSAPNNPDVPLLRYTYTNLYNTIDVYGGSLDYRLQDAGIIMSASRGQSVGSSYDILRPYQGADRESVGGPNNGVNFVRVLGMVNGAVGAIDYAETENGRIDFEHTPRNFPTIFYKHSAPIESYGYDPRGNLSGIGYSGNPGRSLAAVYPETCTPATRKTCNQATRIRDANGNWTDYTYHEESGQVATITLPPNKRGVRAKTTISYEKFGASYYGTDGAWIDGSQEGNKNIWLKTEERSCIDSRTIGACEKGDLVTNYEYNHHNLLLTGVKVTSPDGVRRTCYAYDLYGNQIGVTTPNGTAALTQCPGPAVTP